MRAITATLFLLFFSLCSFGQFKHQQNANGDPLTEIIDPNGMKQGNWNYTDSRDQNFRTENFKDNILVSNMYKLPGASVDVASFRQSNISSFQQKAIKDLAKSLSAAGSGEIIILADNSVLVHIYADKIKNRSAISGINADVLKNYSLQQSIIFF